MIESLKSRHPEFEGPRRGALIYVWEKTLPLGWVPVVFMIAERGFCRPKKVTKYPFLAHTPPD